MHRLKNISALPAAVVMLLLLSPGVASAASTVTVDGIKGNGEYAGNSGGTTSGSRKLLWWNDHKSIFTKAANNMNDLFWEIHDGGGSHDVSLNIFVEVPVYARRMIWAGENKRDGCQYKGGSVSSECALLDPNNDQAYLDAYYAGSHHKSVKMDYKTQTDSEYFKLNGTSVDIDWQAEDKVNDNFTWKTSREYLLDEGICTRALCQEFDRSSSLEVMWTGLHSVMAAQSIVMSITDMQLHLSDEARGLPDVEIPPVPIPAAFWLFGTALIGFIGIARRTRVS